MIYYLVANSIKNWNLLTISCIASVNSLTGIFWYLSVLSYGSVIIGMRIKHLIFGTFRLKVVLVL